MILQIYFRRPSDYANVTGFGQGRTSSDNVIDSIMSGSSPSTISPGVEQVITSAGSSGDTFSPSSPTAGVVQRAYGSTSSPTSPQMDQVIGQILSPSTSSPTSPQIDQVIQQSLSPSTSIPTSPQINQVIQQASAQVLPPQRGPVERVIDDILNTPSGQSGSGSTPPGGSVQDVIDRIYNAPSSGSSTTGPNLQQYSQAIGTLTLQPNGTYRRANDTSIYSPQPDGTLYRTSGRYSPAGQAAADLPNATLYFDGNAIRESNDPIRSWTRPLLRLGLTQNADGTYRMPGEGNSGRILLQPNGTLFHEGGTMNGLVVGPGTYVVTNPATGEGTWQRTGANANPQPGTHGIAALGLRPSRTTGQWVTPPQEGQTPVGHYTVRASGDLEYSGGTDPNTGIRHPWLLARYNPTTRQTEHFRTWSGDPKEYKVYTEPDPANAGRTRYYCVDPTNANSSWYYNPTTNNWPRRSGP